MLLYFIVFEKGGGLISRLHEKAGWHLMRFLICVCAGGM